MGGSTRNYDAYEKRGLNTNKNDPPPPKNPPRGSKPQQTQNKS